MAVPDTVGSSGVESVGHSACSYCKLAGRYLRSLKPAAFTENSSWIQLDPV